MSAVVATNPTVPTPTSPVTGASSTTPSVVTTSNVAQSVAPSSSTSSVTSTNPSSQPYASASLYVGDLNNDVTEALLFEIFNAVGPVASVRVCRDAATRRSLGYAYVNFHRLEDAERALDTLNFKMIRNRACRIMWSHRDPSLRKSGLGNIFINHLAKDIDNKQLYDTFSVFGNILSCKVATNSKRESLGYGFVHYETDESANDAIAKVDGKVILNEKVSVQKFISKKDRPSANAAKNKYTNVFIKNLPLDITVARLEEMFRSCGTITSSSVNIPSDRHDDKARAFGFLNFEKSEEALTAVDFGNNIEILGKKLYCARAQKKEERQKELSERFENLKLERAKKYAGVNLFVKNLSDDIDDNRLTNEFNKFGQISSACIMKDPQTNKSRGFGFVCFSTPEEATKAVTEMNGKMLESKPLYVALAQRKEQRRAQLEAQYAARQKLQAGPLQGGVPLGGGMGGYPGMGPGGMPMMFPQQMQQMQQQRNFINYPQQLMQPGMRWNPQQAAINQQNAAAAMMGMVGQNGIPQRPQQQLNYQLMPAAANNQINNRQNIPQQQMQQGPLGRNQPRGNNGLVKGMMPSNMNGPLPPNMQQNVNAVNLQQQQNIRYNENVRNQSNVGPNVGGGNRMVPSNNPALVGGVGPSDPLTPSALANAPEEMRKQMIGERLFPLVRSSEPSLAGKITGMLLEMDNGELLHLLESREALNEKIQEALQVLQQHSPDEEQQ